jgi:hypothetical protein
MSRIQTLQDLFQRYRRPGDIVFAWFVFAFSLFLLSQIANETAWRPGAKLFAQPRFWPAVSLSGMAFFAGLHLLSSALSPRIEGRWREVGLWFACVEYALWFVAYAAIVPYLGYLPTTVLFAVALTARAGYRSRLMLGMAATSATAIVVMFKTFLQVKLPAGQIYEALPDGLRQIMLTYF